MKKGGWLHAIQWQCHQCMGEYQDGKVDCEITYCSLYEWMPYRKLEPDKTWEQYSPRGVGKRHPLRGNPNAFVETRKK